MFLDISPTSSFCFWGSCCRVLSEQDERFSYFADVGVNSYVTVQISFLPESERRCTRVAAKTFCPEFDHHMEVSCALLIQTSSGETYSLAEQLEEASAVFTVWNSDSRKGLVELNIYYYLFIAVSYLWNVEHSTCQIYFIHLTSSISSNFLILSL